MKKTLQKAINSESETRDIPDIVRDPDKRTTNEILQTIIHTNGWEKQLDLYSIFSQWKKLVVEEISQHATPIKITRDVLWLEVENSSWLTEMQYYTLDILEAVNSRLTLGIIREIKMTLPRKGKTFTPRQKPQIQAEFIPPSADVAAEYKQKTAIIHDEKCRESLFSFWYIAKSCHRSDWKPNY